MLNYKNVCFTGCFYKSKTDIMFLLDGSGSVSGTSFNKMTDFVQTFIDGYETGRNATRFGIIVFSSGSKVEVPLRNSLSKEELLEKTKAVHHPKGYTHTYKALDKVKNICK